MTKPLHSIPARPLIAVPADCFMYDDYLWHGAAEQYLVAANDVAGLTPLIVPSFGTKIDLDGILDQVDGVLITGARSNVGAQNYGKEINPQHGPFDPARDATSLALIRKAVARSIPLLAICRGIQELNVALGGTLVHGVQNIPGRIDHRSDKDGDSDHRFRLKQPVHITPDCCLAAIVGTSSITVNSLHQQGIDEIAPQLNIEAKADDGTIEAVSVKGATSFALGVQWHPEYWAKTDAPSHKIFTAFGDAVRDHHAQRRA